METCDSFWSDWKLEREFEQAKLANTPKQKNIVDELLSDLDQLPRPASVQLNQYFEDSFALAKRNLQEKRRELESRVTLDSKFAEEIDQEIQYAAISLEKFSHFGVGYNKGVDMKRNFLERELSELRSERRSGEARAWTDMVRLRNEFSEALTTYREALRQRRASELQ